jgi:hypothetical protein
MHAKTGFLCFLLIGTGFAAPQADFVLEVDLECDEGLVYLQGVGCVKQCPDDEKYVELLSECIKRCSDRETYRNGQCQPKCSDDQIYNSDTNLCQLIPCTDINEVSTEIRGNGDEGIVEVDLRTIGDNCPSRTCESYADLGFRCVPVHICRNRTIVRDGGQLLDIRTTESVSNDCCTERAGNLDLSDQKCAARNEVCCQLPDYRVKACGIQTRCDEPVPLAGGEDLEQCGRVPKQLSLKLTASKNEESEKFLAQPGEFPHMCLLYRKDNGSNVYIGGASLIGRNKILTVAHKFLAKTKKVNIDMVNNQDIYVRCGEHDVKLKTEFLESQESRVAAVHIHPEYNPKTTTNDLAILETQFNFVYQKHIGRACLPQPFQRFEG